MTNHPLPLGSIGGLGVLAVPLTFDEFVERERDELVATLCVIVGERDQAEDLAKGALATVRERWDRVQGMEHPVTYLRRVAMSRFRRRCGRRLALRRVVPGLATRRRAAPADHPVVLDEALAGLTSRQRAALVLTDLWGYGAADAGRALGVRLSMFAVLSSHARITLAERDEDVRTLLERQISSIGPATFDPSGIERLGGRRRRRETVASLAIALALVAGVVAAARPSSEAARVPVDAVHRSAPVDLQQILLPGSSTPLGTHFVSREHGVATLLGDVPAAAGLARRASSMRFLEPAASPLHEASLETWAVEYDSPVAAQAALSVLALSLHFDWGLVDSRPVELPGADEGLRFVDRSIPRSVVYLWRHEHLLLRLVAGGNLPPRDVRPVALAMDDRAVAATR